jgi:hypothetical protein
MLELCQQLVERHYQDVVQGGSKDLEGSDRIRIRRNLACNHNTANCITLDVSVRWAGSLDEEFFLKFVFLVERLGDGSS